MSTETDILAPAPAWSDELAERLREEGLNHISKREAAADLRRRLPSDVLLMENVIGGPTPERITAMRAHCAAKLAWLEANPGDDLTPERVKRCMDICRDELVPLTELHKALHWVEEIENNSMMLEQKSPTRKAIESRIYHEERTACRWLERCVTEEDSEFLSVLASRSYRARERFRLSRDKSLGSRGGVMLFIDLSPRLTAVAAGLESALARCRTLADVKRLMAVFQTPCRVVTEDGERVVVGEGFRIFRTS